MSLFASIASGIGAIAGVLLCVSADAQPRPGPAPPDEFCRRFPTAEAERLLGSAPFGADLMDDRIGPYRRVLCRFQVDPGDTLDAIEWSRADRGAMPPLPLRAEECDASCIQAGREPNLYTYRQRVFGRTVCVIRQPRADRDVNAGPLTGCYTGDVRRYVVTIQRRRGAAPAPMETVKALLDRAAAK